MLTKKNEQIKKNNEKNHDNRSQKIKNQKRSQQNGSLWQKAKIILLQSKTKFIQRLIKQDILMLF